MKGMVLGGIGVIGVGAAVAGSGGGGPDDYVRFVNKSPQAVYAAFAELGPQGEVTTPRHDGKGVMVQRVTKVQNEQVKLELEVNGEDIIMAEVQMTPEGNGTRLATELDINIRAINNILKEDGQPTLPGFVFQDFLLNQVLAMAVDEMATRIEEGKPLRSLAETHKRWGSGDNGGDSGTFSNSPRGSSPSGGWQQRQASRPQLNARPALDPNEARRDVTPGADDWGR